MFQIILQTLRMRWSLFAGTFVALTLAIAVMAGMGNIMTAATFQKPLEGSPTRYDATSIIIRADQYIHSVPKPEETPESVKLSYRLLSVDVATKLKDIPGVKQVVVDRSFAAAIANNPGASQDGNKQTGHGWSSAQLTPFTLVTGTAPDRGQVVISEAIAQAAGIKTGDTVSVMTQAGVEKFVVAGTVKTATGSSIPGEDTLFFSDATAAKLSGTPTQAEAIGVIAHPGQDIASLQSGITTALSDKNFQVLTGTKKGGNIAAEIYEENVSAVIELTGFIISITGFVCIFVVAGTAAFSIAQRRQEIALLRLVGAMPGQIRRMVIGEAIIIALAAAVVGSLLGVMVGNGFVWFLKHYGVAPEGFTAPLSWQGSAIASGVSIAVAIIGVYIASRRAGKVRAIEAMRDAAAEQKIMTRGRWITGLLFLLSAVALLVVMVMLGGIGGLSAAVFVTEMIAVAFALLMPVFIKPVTWLFTVPLKKTTAAVGELVRANLGNAVRRTTSTAAPILLAVSIAGSLLSVTTMTSDAFGRDMQKRVEANYVVLSDGIGIPLPEAQKFADVPGVASVAAFPTSKIYPSATDLSLSDVEAASISQEMLTQNFDIETRAGSLAEFQEQSAVVSVYSAQELGWRQGQTITVLLADGTPASVRIAALVATTAGLPEVLLHPSVTQGHIQDPLSESVYIKLQPGADAAATADALANVAAKVDGAILTKQAWMDAQAGSAEKENNAMLVLLLGIALMYLGIAIANTLIMAIGDRTADMTLLRKIGTSKQQVLSMIAWETFIVVAIGVVLGLLAALATVLGVYSILHQNIPESRIVMPVAVYLSLIAGSLAIAMTASVVPAAAKLRADQLLSSPPRE